MSIACGQCHASRGSLEPIVEHLENGAIQQTVRCILCGWRVSRTILGPVVTRFPKPEPPPKPARAPSLSHRDRGLKSANGMKYATCAVAGCKGRYVPARDRSGWPLCRSHRHQMASWSKVPRKTPPPLVEVAPGWWDVNPERAARCQAGAPC